MPGSGCAAAGAGLTPWCSVHLEPGLFVRWCLAEHAHPHIVAIVVAFERDVRCVVIVRPERMSLPGHSPQVLKRSTQFLDIQGESGTHHGTVHSAAHKFSGGRVDTDFPEIRFVPPAEAKRAQSMVWFHAVENGIDERFHPSGWLCHQSLLREPGLLRQY